MTSAREFHFSVGIRLAEVRNNASILAQELEQTFGLAPGWIEKFEMGQDISKEILLPILDYIGVGLDDFFGSINGSSEKSIAKRFYAIPQANSLLLQFPYGIHQSQYLLENASLSEFDQVIDTLQKNLQVSKREAVVTTFLKATELWPHANPSDLWWFLLNRAYLDPLNHPAANAGLNLEQSWKRTGGWALEEIVVRFYHEFLSSHGVRIAISDDEERSKIVKAINITDRLEPDKIDVTLHGRHKGQWVFFGVVHVKASFAERRTDDIHMSSLLKSAGFTSPMWTMDCKSTPSEKPINRGELGKPEGKRSAKRRDIEDEGYFTRCFSYNRNTHPSPNNLPADRRIYGEDFSSPDDSFSQFVIQRWQSFMTH